MLSKISFKKALIQRTNHMIYGHMIYSYQLNLNQTESITMLNVVPNFNLFKTNILR